MSGTGTGSTVLTSGDGAGGGDAAAAAAAALADGTKVEKPWFETAGIDAAHHPYISNKGWKAPTDMLESYVNLEKVVGLERSGQSDRILVLPKDPGANAKPEDIEAYKTATAEFRDKAGFTAPMDPKNYELKVPDTYKDDPIYSKAGDIFKEAGVPKHLAQPVLDAVARVQGAAEKQIQDAITAEELELSKDPKFALNKEISMRAVRAAGLTDAEASVLGAALGPKRAMEAFLKLGAAFKEGDTPLNNGNDGKGGSGFQMTKESAIAKAAELRKDPAFQARYLSPNPAVRKLAIEEIEALDKAATAVRT